MDKRAGAALRLLNLGAAGAFTVPKDLTRLRARFDRLAKLAPEPVPSLADGRRDAVSSVLTATLAGRPVNVASVAAKVEGVRAAEAARLTAISILDEAKGVAEAELVTAVGDASAQLCDLLDECLQALRPDFREAAETFAPYVGLTEGRCCGATSRCDVPQSRWPPTAIS